MSKDKQGQSHEEAPKSSKELLLCENPFFLEKSKLSNVLNFNKNEDDKTGKTFKTERVTSNVLSQVKGFLEMVKTNDPKCVNIEENDDENEDEPEAVSEEKSCDKEDSSTTKQNIELNLLLFKHNENDDDSSDSDSENESTDNKDDDESTDRNMVEVIE